MIDIFYVITIFSIYHMPVLLYIFTKRYEVMHNVQKDEKTFVLLVTGSLMVDVTSEPALGRGVGR